MDPGFIQCPVCVGKGAVRPYEADGILQQEVPLPLAERMAIELRVTLALLRATEMTEAAKGVCNEIASVLSDFNAWKGGRT